MIRRTLVALAPALILAAPVAAHAAAPAPAAKVNVTVGPELARKSRRYGERELSYLTTDLANTVRRAAAKGGFTRVDLVLEDAKPNRPTFAMLARETSLSLSSLSVGGAQITGVAYGPNGAQPLKSSWYETDLRQEIGTSTWTDASRAFQFLAASLSKGRVPDRFSPGTPGPERPPVDPRDPWTRDD